MTDALLHAARQVDLVDAAGRIMANPARNASAASAATVYALAAGFEAAVAIVLEAELLVRALNLPIEGTDANAETRAYAIRTQKAAVAGLIAAMRGEPNKPNIPEQES